MKKPKMICTRCGRLVENNACPSSRKYPQPSNGPYDKNSLIPPNSPFCARVNYSVVRRTHGHTQHAQSPMRSHGLFDLSCWWASMCCETEGKWTQREALHRSRNFEPENFVRLTLTKITIWTRHFGGLSNWLAFWRTLQLVGESWACTFGSK